MEIKKYKICKELLILRDCSEKEEKLMDSDNLYSRFHLNMMQKYQDIGSTISRILGTSDIKTYSEVIDKIKSMDITQEQIRQLHLVSLNPIFIKAMGESALQDKVELENVLNTSINNEGETFADETGAYRAYKTEEQLLKEQDINSNKLSQALGSNLITKEQYDKLNWELNSIYSYYISCSNGDQIKYRKISDKEYEQLENKISKYSTNADNMDELLEEIENKKRIDLEDLQDLQQSSSNTKKGL